MKFSSKEFLARLSSRKFLLIVAGIIFYLLGGVLGEFDWNTVASALWKLIAVYVGVEGAADLKRA